MRRALGVLAMLTAMSLVSGCSVWMALAGKRQHDTSVLFPGAPRDAVLDKLGFPDTSTTNEQGERVDSWLIAKGNPPRPGREALNAGLDVLSYGLLEVIGTPLELHAAKEEKTRYVITYDKNDRIKDIKAYRGQQ